MISYSQAIASLRIMRNGRNDHIGSTRDPWASSPPPPDTGNGVTSMLIVGGLLVAIFGVLPALRGTSLRKAWRES